ncbi:MAG: PhnD/SsuA/transferrin family substrate-binding protein [Actinomycetota bacterium]|nr:PhnD/SsuA/transferrin family substrate-binding protein [Actinomycetota bacterium]
MPTRPRRSVRSIWRWGSDGWRWAAGQPGAERAEGANQEKLPDKIVFAAVPAENNESILEDYKPFVEVLSAEIGIPIEFITATDYAGVIEAQVAGRVLSGSCLDRRSFGTPAFPSRLGPVDAGLSRGRRRRSLVLLRPPAAAGSRFSSAFVAVETS